MIDMENEKPHRDKGLRRKLRKDKADAIETKAKKEEPVDDVSDRRKGKRKVPGFDDEPENEMTSGDDEVAQALTSVEDDDFNKEEKRKKSKIRESSISERSDKEEKSDKKRGRKSRSGSQEGAVGDDTTADEDPEKTVSANDSDAENGKEKRDSTLSVKKEKERKSEKKKKRKSRIEDSENKTTSGEDEVEKSDLAPSDQETERKSNSRKSKADKSERKKKKRKGKSDKETMSVEDGEEKTLSFLDEETNNETVASQDGGDQGEAMARFSLVASDDGAPKTSDEESSGLSSPALPTTEPMTPTGSSDLSASDTFLEDSQGGQTPAIDDQPFQGSADQEGVNPFMGTERPLGSGEFSRLVFEKEKALQEPSHEVEKDPLWAGLNGKDEMPQWPTESWQEFPKPAMSRMSPIQLGEPIPPLAYPTPHQENGAIPNPLLQEPVQYTPYPVPRESLSGRTSAVMERDPFPLPRQSTEDNISRWQRSSLLSHKGSMEVIKPTTVSEEKLPPAPSQAGSPPKAESSISVESTVASEGHFGDGQAADKNNLIRNLIKGLSAGAPPIYKETGPGPGKEVSYDSMQRVKIKTVVSRVLDIDTVGQQFDAEVYIQARWTEPNLMGLSEKELNNVNFEECWNPKLRILNLCGGLEKDQLSIMVRYEFDQVHPVVTYMWTIKATFSEPLELEHFPFDVQDLSVILSSERPLDEIDLIPDTQNVSCVSSNAMQNNQEWKIYDHVEFAQDFRSTDFFSSSMHPVLISTCHAKRQLGFYMWNIFAIVFLILGLSLTVLSIDPTTSDRLGVTMTLFLTCVAFKLVVKTTLPHISYLTYLDVYVVFTLAYLAAQAAENAIVSHLARFREREKVLFYDEVAQATLIGLMVLFHAVFLIYIQLTALSRRSSMQTKDHAFHMNVLNAKTDRRSQSSGDSGDGWGQNGPGRPSAVQGDRTIMPRKRPMMTHNMQDEQVPSDTLLPPNMRSVRLQTEREKDTPSFISADDKKLVRAKHVLIVDQKDLEEKDNHNEDNTSSMIRKSKAKDSMDKKSSV